MFFTTVKKLGNVVKYKKGFMGNGYQGFIKCM